MGVLVKEVPNTLTVQEGDIDLSPAARRRGAENGYIKGLSAPATG
jgi:chemotaxis signal transduction protein